MGQTSKLGPYLTTQLSASPKSSENLAGKLTGWRSENRDMWEGTGRGMYGWAVWSKGGCKRDWVESLREISQQVVNDAFLLNPEEFLQNLKENKMLIFFSNLKNVSKIWKAAKCWAWESVRAWTCGGKWGTSLGFWRCGSLFNTLGWWMG